MVTYGTTNALSEAVGRIEEVLLVNCVGNLSVENVSVAEGAVSRLEVYLVLLIHCRGNSWVETGWNCLKWIGKWSR